MYLCLDLGNSSIVGRVYSQDGDGRLTFKYPSRADYAVDELGLLLKITLQDNGVAIPTLNKIVISSVVPALNAVITQACVKHLNIEPVFLSFKDLPSIQYAQPREVGADILAAFIAALYKYPKQDVLIVDMGTATTVGYVSREAMFVGGTILPGIGLSLKALLGNTAMLPEVKNIKPTSIVGNTTEECITAGIYFGHLGGIKENIVRMVEQYKLTDYLVVGTGGGIHLYAEELLFDVIDEYMVLDGLFHFAHETENK